MSEDRWSEPVEGAAGGKYVKWDEAKTVIGVYKGVRRQTSQLNGELQNIYTVETSDGAVALPGLAMLDRLMADPKITVGRRVMIEYTGKSVMSEKNRPVKQFSIRVSGT